jgi:hypothetical protein
MAARSHKLVVSQFYHGSEVHEAVKLRDIVKWLMQHGNMNDTAAEKLCFTGQKSKSVCHYPPLLNNTRPLESVFHPGFRCLEFGYSNSLIVRTDYK